jgi:hypothetical protein
MPVDLGVWLGAPRMGAPVTGFLAFKTPVDFALAFDDEKEAPDEEHEFTVSMFMEKNASVGRSVGLCVDLTTPQSDDRRLYDTEEWSRDWDVEYLSLPCAPPLPETGAAASAWVEAAPSEKIVASFISAVVRFWAEPANRRRHVAVHCVTGVNLAGYLIVRFLMRNAPAAPTLAAFAKSRPPGIYAPELLEAAFRAGSAELSANAKRPASADGGWVQPTPPSWHPLPYRAVDRTAAPPKPAVPTFSAGGDSGSGEDGGAAAAAGAVKRANPLPADETAPPAKRAAAAPAPAPMAPPPVPPATAPAAVSADGAPSLLGHVGTRLEAAEAAVLRRECERLVLKDAAAADGGAADGGAGEAPLPCCGHGERLGHAHVPLPRYQPELVRCRARARAARATRRCSRPVCRTPLTRTRVRDAVRSCRQLEGMRAAAGSWLVTWKAGGTRCVLYVPASDAGAPPPSSSARSAVLFDSMGGAYRTAPMQWPKPGGSAASHAGLVLAGEVVCDREAHGAPPTYRLLCYDLLAVDAQPLVALPLHKRMALLTRDVLEPRQRAAAAAAPAGATPSPEAVAIAAAMKAEPLRVRQKDCFKLKHTAHLLRKFIPKLTHPNKGLVFLRADAPLAVSAPQGGGGASAVDWRRDGAEQMPTEAELLAFADAHFVA